MNLQSLLLYEDKLIQQAVNSKYCNELDNIFKVPSSDILSKINNDLCNTDCGIAIQVHCQLILNLIYTFLTAYNLTDKTLQSNFECQGLFNFSLVDDVKNSEIPSLCENLHIAFLNSMFEYQKGKFIRVKSKRNLIEKGAVYTKINIVNEIVEATIKNYVNQNASFADFSILDFACGTGRFYESIVSVLTEKYGISNNDAVLKYLYAIDIDPVAVNIARLKAISFLSEISEENVSIVSQKILLRNALIQSGLFADDMALKTDDFNGLVNGKFAVVVSNPPYLVLKINKNKGNEELANKIRGQVSYFRTSGQYHYSIEGMLNYYQLSIEAILNMVKPSGEIGIICPSSLFADVSATKLRKHLLLKHNLRGIKYFPEKEPLFENVTQATNIFYLQKNGETRQIDIYENNDKFSIDISLVQQLFPEQMEIPFITEIEWLVLKKMSVAKKLKQISFVRNRRGELDLTLFKEFITTKETPFRLVRGNMICESEIKDINGEYVAESFLKAKSSDFIKNDFKRKRLVCQQISNAGLKKRLKFVFCNETDILGNSCNYLSADEKVLSKLNLLLNSNILNWRFKITSTNNHINNYELDELPIVDLDLVDENYIYQTQAQLDEYVGGIYGLNREEIQFISQR